jgi:uncharacterized OB-fold protein
MENFVSDVCSNCGAPLAEGQLFCSKCGTPKATPTKNVCSNCGSELQDGQEFCSKCGQKVGVAVAPEVNSAINQFNADVQKTNENKKKLPLIIGAVVIAAVLIIVLISGGGGSAKKDFNDMYGDIAGETWCTIASDGSYMKLDTNPYNEDDEDFTWTDYENYFTPANDAIERINKELGFSDALYEKMNSTTWSQGKQEQSNDNYVVTWTYHPDKGLEVMYELKK